MRKDRTECRFYGLEIVPDQTFFKTLHSFLAEVGFTHGFILGEFVNNEFISELWQELGVSPKRVARQELLYYTTIKDSDSPGLKDFGALVNGRRLFVSPLYLDITLNYGTDGLLHSLNAWANRNYSSFFSERTAELLRRWRWLMQRLHSHLGGPETLGFNGDCAELLFYWLEDTTIERPRPEWPRYSFDLPDKSIPGIRRIVLSDCSCGGMADLSLDSDKLTANKFDRPVLVYGDAEAVLTQCLSCGGAFLPHDDPLLVPLAEDIDEFRTRIQHCNDAKRVIEVLGEADFHLPPVPKPRTAGDYMQVDDQLCYTRLFERWIPIVRVFPDGLITVAVALKV